MLAQSTGGKAKVVAFASRTLTKADQRKGMDMNEECELAFDT